MSAEDENQEQGESDLREFRIGVRVDPEEGLQSIGMEVVNGLVNLGGRIVSLQGGGATFRKLDPNEEAQHKNLALTGCDIQVIMDVSGVGETPASQEHDRLYRAGLDLINPYMQIVGRETQPADTETAQEELKRGIELLKWVLDINPGNGSAWWIIGKAEQALDNTEVACDAFGHAYRLKSENADTAREYMYECLKLGRAAQAIAAARHARELKPDDMGLVANLALALLIGGELEEAAEVIEIAVNGAPDDPINVNLQQRIAEVCAGVVPQPRKLADMDAT
ncbi:MAG: tetratricopeptide repeat protein [Gimesia chilikensis]|uniref:tetratricopeptide repeat protein n=1 Tax=Gimesia chilikensis TaxID=2605989 RepID=UPI0037A15F56